MRGDRRIDFGLQLLGTDLGTRTHLLHIRFGHALLGQDVFDDALEIGDQATLCGHVQFQCFLRQTDGH